MFARNKFWLFPFPPLNVRLPIIDAINPVQAARDMWQNLSNKYNSKLIIIECVLDHDLHKQRIESRIRNLHGISEVTWIDVENRRNSYLAWEGERLILDTSNSTILFTCPSECLCSAYLNYFVCLVTIRSYFLELNQISTF